jgi:hypothetical protein
VPKHDDIRRALEARFAEGTSLPVPKPTTGRKRREAGVRWWGPLREIAELVEWREADALQLLDAALARMQAQELTISAPGSILNVARAIVGEVKRGVYRPDGLARGIADLAHAFQAQEVLSGAEVD